MHGIPLTQKIDAEIVGGVDEAHHKSHCSEGIEILAVREGDSGQEQDGVGDDEDRLPAPQVRQDPKHEGSDGRSKEVDRLREGALPGIVADPVHLLVSH